MRTIGSIRYACFFFSSRRRHTRCSRDWSSDVCSSDLFAASALILAAIGVYGLFAYSVAQRRHEIGIRVALGASRGQVLALIVRDGMRLAVIGIALGAAGALVLTRLLAGLLYGIG